jgi:transposase
MTAGYKQSFTLGIAEAGCLAHSRRKFLDLHVSNKSQIAAQALQYIAQLYGVEREVKNLHVDARLEIR